MRNPSAIVEERDAVARLEQTGFSSLLAALRDPRCYTRAGSGRLVLAQLARKLNLSPQQASSLLQNARAALTQ